MKILKIKNCWVKFNKYNEKDILNFSKNETGAVSYELIN